MTENNQVAAELNDAELDQINGGFTLIELLPPPRIRYHRAQPDASAPSSLSAFAA